MREPLENELSRLVPLPPSSALDKRIAAELTYTTPGRGAASHFSDTLLRSLLSLAAAAVVVIVLLLATDGQSSPAPSATVSSAASGSLTIADTPRLLAQLSPLPESQQALPPSTTSPQ